MIWIKYIYIARRLSDMSYGSSTEIGVHIYLPNLLNRATEIGPKDKGSKSIHNIISTLFTQN